MKYLILSLLFIVGCNSQSPSLTPINGVAVDGSGYDIKVLIEDSMNQTLALRLNGESKLVTNQDGVHVFSRRLPANSPYEVTVVTQPTGRTCAPVKPLGFVSETDNTIRVKCTSDDRGFVHGKISGLDNGSAFIRLYNSNNTINETIELKSGDLTYFFESPTYHNYDPTITIVSSPAGRTCTLEGNGITTTAYFDANGTNSLNNIVCRSGTNSNVSYSYKINNLGSDKISISTPSGTTTWTGSGPGVTSLTNVYTGKVNQRVFFEITSLTNSSNAPLASKRCYFSGTGHHLYSETPVSTASVILEIECETRTVSSCELGSREYPSVNGKLNDVDCANGKLVYGGDFTHVGRQLGVVPFSGDSVSFPSSESFDRIHGKVNVFQNDPNGGWFIGGSFDRVGDKSIHNIVHLDNRLIIHEDFKVHTNGEVKNIKLSDNRLVVQGLFSTITIGNVVHNVNGFAILDISQSLPKLFPTRLPSTIRPLDGEKYVMIIDRQYVVMHGRFNIQGASRSVVLSLNQFNGSLTTLTTNAPENGNTQFWREYLTGKMWMINQSLGMIDIQTGASHPYAHKIAKGTSITYFVDPIDNLYISDANKVLKIKLTQLATDTPVSFGKIAGTAYDIKNANFARFVGTSICFTQRAAPLKINTTIKNTMACFNSLTEDMTTMNMSVPQVPTALEVYGSSFILAMPHGVPSQRVSLAVIDANTGTVDTNASPLAPGEIINTVASDGQHAYLGGSFLSFAGCPACSYVAKLAPVLMSVDNSWYLQQPLSFPARKMKVHGTQVLMTTEDPDRELILTETNSVPLITATQNLSSIPSDVGIVTGGILSQEGNTKVFRDPNTLGASASLPGTAPFTAGSDFWIAQSSPSLTSYDFSGNFLSNVTYNDYGSNPLLANMASANATCLYSQDRITCIDNSLNIILSKPVVREKETVFKGVGNFLFLGQGNSSPRVFKP